MKIKSYAKINYNLKIVEKASNGYHKLESIMSLIDFYDDIVFEESEKIEVYTKPFVCKEEENLCYKVACYLKKFSKEKKGIKIVINKRIPVGGGLGGGSSNAAVTMLYLNCYWKLNFNRKKLMNIAFGFGADIPFFLYKRQSRVSGFGEKIRKISKPIIKNIILIVPPFSLSTKDVFRVFVFGELNDKRGIVGESYNDLEKSANMISGNKIEEIKTVVNGIGKGYSLMSGSGSSVVYYVDDELEDVVEVYNKIKLLLPECKIYLSKMKSN